LIGRRRKGFLVVRNGVVVFGLLGQDGAARGDDAPVASACSSSTGAEADHAPCSARNARCQARRRQRWTSLHCWAGVSAVVASRLPPQPSYASRRWRCMAVQGGAAGVRLGLHAHCWGARCTRISMPPQRHRASCWVQSQGASCGRGSSLACSVHGGKPRPSWPPKRHVHRPLKRR
jgi:hypothetical protein